MRSPYQNEGGWSRRNFLSTSVASTVTVTMLDRRGQPAHAAVAAPGAGIAAPVLTNATVNGRPHRFEVDARTTLLDALREHAGLTGTKKGCDHGQCGACTVLANGRRILSCLTFTASLEGAAITTIEGLAEPDGGLHPMQQAFIDHDAFQCGTALPARSCRPLDVSPRGTPARIPRSANT